MNRTQKKKSGERGLAISQATEKKWRSTVDQVKASERIFDVWRTLEKKFGVQFEAMVLQLRYELNTLRKESMSIEDYCIKMKIVADKLASAGSPITVKDLMLTILNSLGAGYRDIATFIID
ncbi:hypothetical protein CUMW_147500 [Citrus unshiu]|uniref:Retrotransposon gag domain-containing protein n=1 Tax=Citrus sinensis TaxID=2711 RepID=A0A067DLS0_CITSI|nr:hypothetical protein CISIN_1g040302mg [Citrus sinensis]GAY53191.1 hypothetical protein CUMW_147500 [Citrus unshiu]